MAKQTKASSLKALAEHTKKSGDAYTKAPIYRADVAKMPKGRTDYGKRQSQNIEDIRDKVLRPGAKPARTKAYTIVDAIGKQEQKARESSALDSSRIKNVSDDNTRNRNLTVNSMREKYGSIAGRHVKNVKLDSKPTTFRAKPVTTSEKSKKKKKSS